MVTEGERNEYAAWYYPHPPPLAQRIKGHVAFWRGVDVVEYSSGPMTITIRYFDGCPHWTVARQRVDEAIRVSGRSDVLVQLEMVDTPEAAEQLHFIGSPTVLVDGRDPFDPGGSAYGMSCRRFSTEAGMEGAPSVAQLVKEIHG